MLVWGFEQAMILRNMNLVANDDTLDTKGFKIPLSSLLDI